MIYHDFLAKNIYYNIYKLHAAIFGNELSNRTPHIPQT
jgi:hypothetical protein